MKYDAQFCALTTHAFPLSRVTEKCTEISILLCTIGRTWIAMEG